jgi:pimeloyl-ACP methyl ester carboxylesterase
MATFVLVAGAWHGGWCWRKVTPLLRAAGHEVFAPTLTGLGERSHLAHPDVGLTTHIQDIVNLLEYEDLNHVVLVGHSFSGMVITGVAEQVPGRLAHLVYLDAFVPENGQALVDLLPPEGRQSNEARVRAEGDGWRLLSLRPVPWETFLREEWRVTDEADVRWMVARLGPQPFKTMTEPVRYTNPAAAALPRTYVRCVDFPNPAFDRFAARSRQEPGWRYRELASSHDVMVTMPRELAELLLEVA